jgi:hypothetical protein
MEVWLGLLNREYNHGIYQLRVRRINSSSNN